ncbi:MAG: diaminopimelate decarboxylase, partial [Sulfurospirillum sp.]|nr:diaminopimelate decarboxylase [Sulfurospirillum sp.]
MDFKSLAKEYGTPLYVYDFDYIEKQFNSLKEAFKARKSLICYAAKANSNLSVLKHVANLGAGCDCVSIGEVKRALYAGVAKYKIIFSGVGKRDEEIQEALKEDILMINLESEE